MKKWPVEKVKLSEMSPAVYNPRAMKEEARDGLSNSMKSFGILQYIVWNKRTGNIVGGHQRYDILKKEGVDEVEAIVVDLDDENEVALNATLNNPEIQGQWNDFAEDVIKYIEGNTKELYDSLRFNELYDMLSDNKTKKPSSKVVSCPCCENEWELMEEDVEILEEKK
jgi:hypothetical protein